MAITPENNFKKILDKIESIVETEFKCALPTCVGYEKMHGTQYLRILPLSSSLVDYTPGSEEREYNVRFIF